MPALLIDPQGRVMPADEEADEEQTLRDAEAVGQIVNLSITDDMGHMFAVWMAIDPVQPVNSKARSVISSLAALHMMCFGPVLITQIDEDLALEITGG